MNSIYRRVTRNYGWRTLAILLVAASSLLAYPTAGTLTLNGNGDSLGAYSFTVTTFNPPQTTGNGGGHVGTISGPGIQPPITELFCDDFMNSLAVTSANVNVSSLGDAIAQNGAAPTLTDTRFGGVTSWKSISTVATDFGNCNFGPAGCATTKSTLDGLNALQRYEVAAYLMTQYTFFTANPSGNNFHNVQSADFFDGGLQAAIWAILDPSAESIVTLNGIGGTALATGLDNALTAAATWWNNPTTANRAFLANVMIATDTQVAAATGNAKLNVGIQELMYVVPEPSFYALLAAGLGLLVWRRKRLA